MRSQIRPEIFVFQGTFKNVIVLNDVQSRAGINLRV